MSFGLPYMGSKNKIAMDILEHLPPADNLYDLFMGGGSITHAAMLTNKYRNFHINDIDEKLPKLFVDAIQGKYADEKRWISREDFKRLAKDDAYIELCWSFGNSRREYMYSVEIEPWQKALHYAYVYGDTSLFEQMGIDIILSDRLSIKKQIIENEARYRDAYGEWYLKQHGNNPDVGRLNELQSLERLQRLQSLEGLHSYSGDYQSVPIKPNSVIYCDIPYAGTADYVCGKFDHERFYKWVSEQSEPIFISSYEMPEDRFDCVWEHKHRCTLSAVANNEVVERLFVPKRQQERGNVGLFGGVYAE